jgi:hypothetical protein
MAFLEGELIFANVLDVQQRAAAGDTAPGSVLIVAPGSRALPFVCIRDWKAPTGYLTEEIELVSPTAKVAHRLGPMASHMLGQLDVTRLETVVHDAVFDEVGTHLASYMLESEVVAQTEFQVVLRPVPAKLPATFEDGLKRSDVIWAGVEQSGKDRTAPVWFAYRNGKVYLLSKVDPGPEEQRVPGIPGAGEAVVITRRKGRDTSLERFRASVRLLEGDEWEQAAVFLVDRRRSRVGPPQASIDRWRGTCAIAELTPIVPA